METARQETAKWSPALGQAQDGQLVPVRQMASELWAWFLRHTQSLDAALALHMRRAELMLCR